MKIYIVSFKLNGKEVFSAYSVANNKEDAIKEAEFKPYFYMIDYDEVDAWEYFT